MGISSSIEAVGKTYKIIEWSIIQENPYDDTVAYGIVVDISAFFFLSGINSVLLELIRCFISPKGKTVRLLPLRNVSFYFQ